MSLSAGDIAWIRETHVPEFIDHMVADLLYAHPADPVTHIQHWLQRQLPHPFPAAPGPASVRETPRTSRPSSASHRPIMEELQDAQDGGDHKQLNMRDMAMLRRMSAREQLTQVVNRRVSMPNLAMRTNSLRNAYFAAHPLFHATLNRIFPGAMPEMDMIAKATKLLLRFGFKKGNAIPMISVCRDELTRSLVDDIEELWGPSFSTGSIAGMVFCGKTGMMAGMAHAPQNENGMEHYIFVSSPHIAISEDGEVGTCFRVGRSAPSHACGSLCAMLGELKRGSLNVQVDTHDMEQSMMKQQLAGLLKYGQVPTLDELTKKAQVLIKHQVESTLNELKLKNMEFAFISGVQVHGPDNANFFWLTDFYVQKADGQKEHLDFHSIDKVDATDLLQEAYANDYLRIMSLIQEGDMDTVKKWVGTGLNYTAKVGI
eukprot:EG_transcript_8091